MMPKIAEGDANKVWIVPSEIGKALEGLGSTMNQLSGIPQEVSGPRKRVDMGPATPQEPKTDSELKQTNAAVQAAIAEAANAANPASSSAADQAPSQDASGGADEVPPAQ